MSTDRQLDRAVRLIVADLLLNEADGTTFVQNGYPTLIVFNPQSFRTKKEFLRVAKHEWAHVRGGNERQARRAEYRK